uniref:Wsv139-like protein n=1 Tax=Sicyonia whispovirus TaxID=2984283 RepID=A0A9C7BX27_9VIRU|nr:MAG: wsv139-like protein [Sicyonia whispovirus]
MGIHGAGKVYESVYGFDGDRVIKKNAEFFEANNDDAHSAHTPVPARVTSESFGAMVEGGAQGVRRVPDYSLDMVDLPTFSIGNLNMLGRDVANKIKMGAPDCGQIFLLVNRTTNRVENYYHDQNKTRSRHDAFGHSGLQPGFEVLRIPVTIPSSQQEVEACLSDRALSKMKVPPASKERMCDYQTTEDWLSSHDFPEQPVFMTNRFLYNKIYRLRPKMALVNKFRNAYYASKMEGLLLLYAINMVKSITSLLSKSKVRCGRHIMFFVDNQTPAIKLATRDKRKVVQESSEMRKRRRLEEARNGNVTRDQQEELADSLLIISCERLLMGVPTSLTQCALFDVMGHVLAKKTNAKSILLSQAYFSEGEDEIVRLASYLLNLETPPKHFQLAEKKTMLQYNTLQGDTSQSSWAAVVRAADDHVAKNRTLAVNIFSHDSDVLAKWNLMVAHHSAVRRLCEDSRTLSGAPGGSEQPLPSRHPLRLLGMYFYRSLTGNRGGGLRQWRGCSSPGGTLYDLSQSPLLLTPENTLLVMLANGSDYNSSLVSQSSRDVLLRTEAVMFESTCCTCVSGWRVYLDAVMEESRQGDAREFGDVSLKNVARAPCGGCGKPVVLPFWTAKFYFAAQAVEFLRDPGSIFSPPAPESVTSASDPDKVELHRALAVNAAANVMAYMALGSFNQKVFGSMTCANKMIEVIRACGAAGSPGLGLDRSSLGFLGDGPVTRTDEVEASLEKLLSHKRSAGKFGACEGRDNNDSAGSTGVCLADTCALSPALAVAVYRARAKFFQERTEGGLLMSHEAEYEAEKASVFGGAFAPADHDHNHDLGHGQIDDLEEDTSKSPPPPPWVSTDNASDEEQDLPHCPISHGSSFAAREDNGGWIHQAAQALAGGVPPVERPAFLEEMERNERQNGRSQPPSEAVDFGPETPRDALHWDELVVQFENGLSLCSSMPEDKKKSLLSRLSQVLGTKVSATRQGHDHEDDGDDGDDGTGASATPYSIKAMNLLVIIYINMCGLEDSSIVDRNCGQLEPITHAEYSGRQATVSDCETFKVAALEFTVSQYKSEICGSYSLPQIRRKNAREIRKRIKVLERQTTPCAENCRLLARRAFGETKQSRLVPGCGYFIPALGLSSAKPWTPLSLWSSFLLLCKARSCTVLDSQSNSESDRKNEPDRKNDSICKVEFDCKNEPNYKVESDYKSDCKNECVCMIESDYKEAREDATGCKTYPAFEIDGGCRRRDREREQNIKNQPQIKTRDDDRDPHRN